MICSVSILHLLRDNITFTLYETACDLKESFIFNTAVEICVFSAHFGDDPKGISRDLAPKNWSPFAILRRCLRDDMFSVLIERRVVTDRPTDVGA